MTQEHPKDPLHGISLALILERLVAHLGWAEMGFLIPIRCFTHDPSINSSLKFLRRTPWARTKVESLYLHYRNEFVAPDRPLTDSPSHEIETNS